MNDTPPQHPTPEKTPHGLSVIIPLGKASPGMNGLLTQLAAVVAVRPLEIIVVDQTATDELRELLARHARQCFVRHCRVRRGLSPAAARNYGSTKARHPFLLFLDATLPFAADMLSQAMDVLARDGQVCAVGARHPSCDALCNRPAAEATGVAQPCPALSAAFLLVGRQDFVALSGFREDGQPGLEDADFCLRLAQRQRKKCQSLRFPSRGAPLPAVPPAPPEAVRIFRERWGGFLHEYDRATHPPASGAPVPAAGPLPVLLVLPEANDPEPLQQAQVLAAKLRRQGIRPRIALPAPLPAGRVAADVTTYATVLADPDAFFVQAGARPLLYAWTPREGVRRFCETLMDRFDLQLVVHRTHKEEERTAARLGRSLKDLAGLSESAGDAAIPADCYHPVKGKRFLERARALTLAHGALADAARPVAQRILGPLVDEGVFYPRPVNNTFRHKLGIDATAYVIGCIDAVHTKNLNAISLLSQVINILRGQGISAFLLVHGQQCENSRLDNAAKDAIRCVKDVERTQYGEVMAAANVLVAAEKPDSSIVARASAHLADFFALGRPIVSARAVVGPHVVHGQDAYVVETVDGQSFAKALGEVYHDQDLAQKLAAGALAFYLKNCCPSVENLYSFFNAALRACKK